MKILKNNKRTILKSRVTYNNIPIIWNKVE